jgi:hypothetical protein
VVGLPKVLRERRRKDCWLKGPEEVYRLKVV